MIVAAILDNFEMLEGDKMAEQFKLYLEDMQRTSKSLKKST